VYDMTKDELERVVVFLITRGIAVTIGFISVVLYVVIAMVTG